MATGTTVSRIALSSITCDPEIQPRADMSAVAIEDYAERMKAGDIFPPILVFDDGESLWLTDGFHRFAGALLAGITTLDADVTPGTRRDALLHAATANQTHGLRRSNEDKRRAVLRLLNDPDWSEWSDREIARRVGVHHNTVAALRDDARPPTGEFIQLTPTPNEVTKERTNGAEEQPAPREYVLHGPKRLGRDGKRRQMPQRPPHDQTTKRPLAPVPEPAPAWADPLEQTTEERTFAEFLSAARALKRLAPSDVAETVNPLVAVELAAELESVRVWVWRVCDALKGRVHEESRGIGA